MKKTTDAVEILHCRYSGWFRRLRRIWYRLIDRCIWYLCIPWRRIRGRCPWCGGRWEPDFNYDGSVFEYECLRCGTIK